MRVNESRSPRGSRFVIAIIPPVPWFFVDRRRMHRMNLGSSRSPSLKREEKLNGPAFGTFLVLGSLRSPLVL